MAWWQGVLIILGFIVVGAGGGLLLGKLILRIKKQRSYSRSNKNILVIGEESEQDAEVSTPPTKAQDKYKNITVIDGDELDRSAHTPLTKIYDDFKNIGAIGKQSEPRASVPSPPETAVNEKPETIKAPEIVECAGDRTKEADTVQAEMAESQVKSAPSDLSAEAEQNLAIASTPWTGKLLSFQTGVWDRARGEACPLPLNLQRELTEAYTDMHLANNIVWLSTNVGRRSAELDDNYIKLCSGIKERLGKVIPALK